MDEEYLLDIYLNEELYGGVRRKRVPAKKKRSIPVKAKVVAGRRRGQAPSVNSPTLQKLSKQRSKIPKDSIFQYSFMEDSDNDEGPLPNGEVTQDLPEKKKRRRKRKLDSEDEDYDPIKEKKKRRKKQYQKVNKNLDPKKVKENVDKQNKNRDPEKVKKR